MSAAKKAKTSDGDSATPQLTGLPSSVLLVGVCAFLPLEDIFTLRLVSPSVKAMLHGEGQDDLWKLVLQRDFEFTAKDLEDGPIETLVYNGPVDAIRPSVNSSPGEGALAPSTNMIEPGVSFFESVKKWRKISAWYYQGASRQAVQESLSNMKNDQQASLAAKSIAAGRQPHVHGSYFLRAARFWQNLMNWFENGPTTPSRDGAVSPQESYRVRQILKNALSPTGKKFVSYSMIFGVMRGMEAKQALTAFCRGTSAGPVFQNGALSEDVYQDGVLISVLGAYEAYRHYRVNALFERDELRVNPDFVLGGRSFRGCVTVDPASGGLYFDGLQEFKPISHSDNQSRCDELLRWLEEYIRRLTTGELDIGMVGSSDTTFDAKGILLFPRYVPGRAQRLANGLPVVSRKVTRGVEVIASAVFDPARQHDMGFIYSFRIRLLSPIDGDEYVTQDERGFVTCTFLSRHWRITDDDTGRTQSIDGEGLIGMFPTLSEGGYGLTEHEFISGTFQYQSCTGPMKRGSFGGHLTFEARHQDRSVSRFEVEVGRFALDSEPEYLF